MKQSLKLLLRNLALYGVFGGISAGMDTLVFSALCYCVHVPWQLANIVSVLLGISLSFYLNRRYNFKVFDHPKRRAAIFFGVGLSGLVLSQTILWIGSELSANILEAKLISIVFVALFQFVLNKVVSFGVRF